MDRVHSTSLKMLLAGILASSILTPIAIAQSDSPGTNTSVPGAKQPVAEAANGTASVAASQGWRLRNAASYKRNWGVDIVGVRLVSSGHMLEFRYRVLDSTKAMDVNDKRATPYLIDEKSGVRLNVPVMEKIGQLRQTSLPKDDQTYWMIFANEGKIVRHGDKVDLSIGKFHCDGLIVD
jgi:hypothetical protein